MSAGEGNEGLSALFKGPYVWSGIAMALGGTLGETLVGAGHAFEFLMFFGGLNLGIGVTQNRKSARAVSADGPSGG